MTFAIATGPGLIVALAAVWVILNAATAFYGKAFGYPFFPLFVAGLVLGFPVVLLVVAIASRHRPEPIP